MYTKLFSKILDSSVWLQPTHTRLVWITLLAAMDADGFAHFSALANLASRARLPIKQTQAAVTALESPDPDSNDPSNDGRRIERVPGGWIVLNAAKYREIASQEIRRAQVRKAVRDYRERKKKNNSEANTEAYTYTEGHHEKSVRDYKVITQHEPTSNLDEWLPKFAAIGFRASTRNGRSSEISQAAQSALVDVCADGADPAEVYAAALRIYTLTGKGAYAPRLHEVIHRWKEEAHLWSPPERKSNRKKSIMEAILESEREALGEDSNRRIETTCVTVAHRN